MRSSPQTMKDDFGKLPPHLQAIVEDALKRALAPAMRAGVARGLQRAASILRDGEDGTVAIPGSIAVAIESFEDLAAQVLDMGVQLEETGKYEPRDPIAAEREACAKVVDGFRGEDPSGCSGIIAAAIRARGKA